MNIYFILVVCFILVGYFLDLFVELLNLKNINSNLNDEFKGYYDEEKYKKSQKYLKETTSFKLIINTFFTVLILAFVVLGGFNIIDVYVRTFNLNSVFTGLLFVAVLIFGKQILSIPFSLYNNFVIETKYGFNLMTLKTFFLDLIKSIILTIILGGIIFAAILLFFEKAGSLAWLYCWGFVFIYQLFIMYIAPNFIMPLFNKFEPLEDGELKTKIEEFAKAQNFHLKGLFKMDGSKRSTKSNAFFTGLGKNRRIVLFDTLIEKHTVDELVSILAHEVGHYKKKHILKMIILSTINAGAIFYIMSLFINNKDLFDAFKMEHLSIYGSLIFFMFLYSPISTILSVGFNKISRNHEYEADVFAIRTYGKKEAFIDALKKLSVNNLSNLTPHPIKVVFDYSHPPVLDRIKAIKKTAS